MRIRLKTIFFLLSFCFLVSFTVSEKDKSTSEKLSLAANKYMWDNLHSGNYDSIPFIILKLKEAYSQNKNNPEITAHLAFTYLWAFSERGRKAPDPSYSEYVYQSNYFFKEAIKLNPKDARLRGFQSATDICQGALQQKWLTLAKGYVNGIRAIKRWPQFNKFAFSLVGSQRGKNTPIYNLAMKFQWQLLDDCSCKVLDKETVLSDPEKTLSDLIAELAGSPDNKKKRVCWNSWIAPHNLEGFFLNFGDMLVKAGEIKTARDIYSAAKLSPTYKEWPFQSVLEERIKNAEQNEKEFNKPLELVIKSGNNQIFINSSVSCVACHQMSGREFEVLANKN
jgi:hypothetical protein